MANYRVLFAFIFILMLFLTFFLSLSTTSRSARINEAEDMSASLRTYMQLNKDYCNVRPDDFVGFTACLDKYIDEFEVVADMDEDDYTNFNTKTNATGFVVLVNKGRNTLESGKFTLLFNLEVVDTGCVIQGNIDKEYSCRLNFNKKCDSGDVLEAKYDGKRVYLKNC